MTGRLLLVAALAALTLAACGEGADDGGDSPFGLEHVHGLGVNPGNGALYIATHHGLFRSAGAAGEVERVGDGVQDTMGFTIAGSDHFLASGHPGPGEPGPPNLGLIESRDAGESWREVSLGGEADFHVLRFAQGRIYGYDASGDRLMLSDDDGTTWVERQPPAPVIDLAIDPDNPRTILASTEMGLAASEDDGRSWSSIGGPARIGLLAWPAAERLYLVDAGGEVRLSRDRGESWREVGRIEGPPSALAADGRDELYAALADATIIHSADGGSTWQVRARPP